MYFDYTYLLMLPGLILGLWAQWKVKAAYEKYGKIRTRRGEAACDLVRQLLYRENADVAVEETGGVLTDHYDPRTNVLRLSQGVYRSDSVAAVGIAAHEAGHALQKLKNYRPLGLRTAIVPVVNVGSYLAWPLFVGGIAFSFEPLMTAGIAVFALMVLFSLITLPVEFDASRRAKRMLAESGYFEEDELQGVSKVLSAAAMTYVASFISAALQLLRLLLIAQRRRR